MLPRGARASRCAACRCTAPRRAGGGRGPARRGQPRRRRGRGARARRHAVPNRARSNRRAARRARSSCCPARAAPARRARALPPGHERAARARGGRRAGANAGDRRLRARMRLEAPAVVTRGDRFILRAYSPLDDDRRRRGARSASAARARFAPPPGARGSPRSTAATRGCGAARSSRSAARRLPRPRSSAARGLSPRRCRRAGRALVRDGQRRRRSAICSSPRVLERARGAAGRGARGAPRGAPLVEGMPREEARERMFRRAAPAVFELRRGRPGRRRPDRRARSARARGPPRVAVAGGGARPGRARASVSARRGSRRRISAAAGRPLASTPDGRRAGASRCWCGSGAGQARYAAVSPDALEALKAEVRALKSGGTRTRGWTSRRSRSGTASRGSMRFRCWSTWTGSG